jgi:hypothetical protein
MGLRFRQMDEQKVRDGTASRRTLLTVKDLKAKEIQMDLTDVYGNEGLRISAVQK